VDERKALACFCWLLNCDQSTPPLIILPLFSYIPPQRRTHGSAAPCQITPAALAALAAACPLLHSLALFTCPLLPNAALAALDSSSALRALTLHGCPQITAGGLARFVIAHAARLRLLDVAPCVEAGGAGGGGGGGEGGGGGCFTPDVCAAIAAHCQSLQVGNEAAPLLLGVDIESTSCAYHSAL
jgi:hypothetical protein